MFPYDTETLAVVDYLQLGLSLANVSEYDLLCDISGKRDQYQNSGDASSLVTIEDDQILVELLGPGRVDCVFEQSQLLYDILRRLSEFYCLLWNRLWWHFW